MPISSEFLYFSGNDIMQFSEQQSWDIGRFDKTLFIFKGPPNPLNFFTNFIFSCFVNMLICFLQAWFPFSSCLLALSVTVEKVLLFQHGYVIFAIF